MIKDDRLNRVQMDLKVKWPRLHYTGGGKAIFSGVASLATKAKDGDPAAKGEWVYLDVSVIAWEDVAEALGEACADGDTVRITNGYMGVESGYYSKKKGVWTEPRVQVTALEAHILGGGSATPARGEHVYDDSIPF